MGEKITIIEEWGFSNKIYCFQYVNKFGLLKATNFLKKASYDKLEIGQNKVLIEACYGKLEIVEKEGSNIIFRDAITNKLGLLKERDVIFEPIYDSIERIEKSKIIIESGQFEITGIEWYLIKKGNEGILLNMANKKQVVAPKINGINKIYYLRSFLGYTFIIVEGSENWYGISVGMSKEDTRYIPILKINQLIEKKLFYIESTDGVGIFDAIRREWLIAPEYDEMIEITKSLSMSELLQLEERELTSGIQTLEGMGSIWQVKKNNKYGIIQLRGTINGNCEFFIMDDNKIKLQFRVGARSDIKEEFNTREMNKVSELTYDKISKFKLICGRYIAGTIREGYYGYIYIDGTELMPCRFDEAKLHAITDFKGNKNIYAYVRKDGKQGVYKLGEGLIVNCIFKDIIKCIIAQEYKIIVFIEEQEEKWAVINLVGQCEYVVLKSKLYNSMYYVIEHNGKYGVADKYLKILLPGTYNSRQECEKWVEAIERYISEKELSPLIEENMSFEGIRKYIVSIDGLLIKDMNMPSKVVQTRAVHQNGLAIQFIDKPDLEVQLVAVRQNGLAIQFIDKPDLEVELESVRQNGSAIKYIKMQSTRAQLIAVRQDITNLQYINDQIELLESNKIEIKPKIMEIIDKLAPDVQDVVMVQRMIQSHKKLKEQQTPEIKASAYSIKNNREYITYEDGMWNTREKQYHKKS